MSCTIHLRYGHPRKTWWSTGPSHLVNQCLLRLQNHLHFQRFTFLVSQIPSPTRQILPRKAITCSVTSSRCIHASQRLNSRMELWCCLLLTISGLLWACNSRWWSSLILLKRLMTLLQVSQKLDFNYTLPLSKTLTYLKCIYYCEQLSTRKGLWSYGRISHEIKLSFGDLRRENKGERMEIWYLTLWRVLLIHYRVSSLLSSVKHYFYQEENRERVVV